MRISRNGWIASAVGLVIVLGSAAIVLRKGSPGSDSVGALMLALSRPRTSMGRDSSVAPRLPPSPPDAKTLAVTLRDSSWQTRLAAVNGLRERGDIPVAQRAELLLSGLAREIAQPTDSLAFPGSYLPSTTTFRLQFLRVMEGLGPDAIPPARQAAAQASQETREWMLLAQAGAGDRQASAQIRDLLRSSRAGPVRMTAARLLGRLRDSSAVPDLENALKDPFNAIAMDGDLDLPPHSFYPVREQAAGSLRAFGVPVRRNGATFTVP